MTMNKYALIIPTYENNVGFKLAALNTYLKHKPDNLDVFFLYGGNKNFINKIFGTSKPYEWYEVFVPVPDQIKLTHKKLFKFFSLHKKILSNYKHIIKIDDDTFINNIDEINFDKIKGDFIGKKIEINNENETTIRNKIVHLKKYKIYDEYKGDLPEYYSSGECVIFSNEAIKSIISYNGGFKRTKYGLEDIFTSHILNSNNFKIINNKYISYEHPVIEADFYKNYSKHYS